MRRQLRNELTIMQICGVTERHADDMRQQYIFNTMKLELREYK